MDVFVSNHSRGLMVDALVLQNALGADRVRILTVPFRMYGISIEESSVQINFDPEAEIAVFIENIFAHEKLKDYKKRIFIPNPEWLTVKDKERVVDTIDEVWHKTKFGMKILGDLLPDVEHKYTGFTSLGVPGEAVDFSRFAHFPGKSKTRHTQDVINIWLKNTALESITIQMYGTSPEFPRWIESANIRIFSGFLNEGELYAEYVKSGIHICTSQMEGFGHYINEARSIGALVVTLDAPPMNELIDSNCGVLIPTTRSIQHNHGLRFIATPEAIEQGILAARRISIDERKRMGARARYKFEQERNDFLRRLHSIALGESPQPLQ
jgi:hypothetical protein